MKLTPRLLTIANFVSKDSVVADIGTDHGYIPVYLIKKQISKKVIAADINKGPLLSAQKTVREHGLEDFIETRLGNGLQPIDKNEVDTVIIAGMGGMLIRDILMDKKEVTNSVKRFILQPMTAQEELRRWLVQNNFKIIDEKLSCEGDKIYEIMVVEQGKQEIDEEIYFVVSKKLIEEKDPLVESFVKKHIRKQENIIKSLMNQETEKAKEKLRECKEKIEKLEGVLKCLKS